MSVCLAVWLWCATRQLASW